jgi:hypothetical protein
LDKFEREINIYNPSVARITESLRGSIRHGTATVYSDDHVPARTRSTLGTYHPRTERSARVERAFRATKMSFLRAILDGAALRLDRALYAVVVAASGMC